MLRPSHSIFGQGQHHCFKILSCRNIYYVFMIPTIRMWIILPFIFVVKTWSQSDHICYGASSLGLVLLVLFKKISIPTMMNNGADGIPLMLITFTFVSKVSLLNVEITYIFMNVLSFMTYSCVLNIFLMFLYWWGSGEREGFLQLHLPWEVLIILLWIHQKVFMCSMFHLLHTIHVWNNHNSKNIEWGQWICFFAYATDDGLLLLFIPMKKDVRTFVTSYGFELHKDWWGFDELPSYTTLATSLISSIR
jgi:hypothetical protein